MQKQPDPFKPTAPPAGRDWLTRGFGLHRCRCEKCDPPEEREQKSPAVPPFAAPEPQHERKLEIAGTRA